MHLYYFIRNIINLNNIYKNKDLLYTLKKYTFKKYMSQSSFKNNVINRIIDMNIDNNITNSLSSIQSATTAALSAVSSAFKTNPFIGHQMDVLSNGMY